MNEFTKKWDKKTNKYTMQCINLQYNASVYINTGINNSAGEDEYI